MKFREVVRGHGFGADLGFGVDPVPVVTGPTAADMLLQQLMIHGAGTSTILQADTAISGNLAAQNYAKLNSLAYPPAPDNSFVRGETLGPLLYHNDKLQAVSGNVPASAVHLSTDGLLSLIERDVGVCVVNTWVAQYGPPPTLVMPSDDWINNYIQTKLRLPTLLPDGSGLYWNDAMRAKWLPVLNAAVVAAAVIPGIDTPLPPPVRQPVPGLPKMQIQGYGCCGGYGRFEAYGDVLWTVRPGDSLTLLAAMFGICEKGPGNTTADWADCLAAAQRIADANGLPDVNQITVGQQLVIPVPVEPVPTVAAETAVVSQSSNGGLMLFGLGLGVVYMMMRGSGSKKRRRR